MNLASLRRPKNLEDFICEDWQRDFFARIIQVKDDRSFLFFGPPGSGKTTISLILANEMQKSFAYFNAAIDNKQTLVNLIEENEILIVDEIHRLNKDKQDILLPHLENQSITVYATTTENPFFKVNPALRSRMNIFEFKKPTDKLMLEYAKNINQKLELFTVENEDVYRVLVKHANRDFRILLSDLELLAKLYRKETIDVNKVKLIFSVINFGIDQDGNEFYNHLSAFHKSLRGSDPDGALYWGYLLYKSKNFDDMFRRMICASYEDVGLANPSCGSQTLQAIEAFERLGEAEGYLPIAFAILNIALSPKSNSVIEAWSNTSVNVENRGAYDVPTHLKDSHYKSAKKLGHGVEYKYPHNYQNHWVKQQYLPDELTGQKFYTASENSYEQKIYNYWKKIKGE
ncbi:replication-associated recombination protein A [Mycoplasma sp. 128]|uniref:replication-associated recombination protein A n=1 Tax=Mycoplasma sp. 3341 TaxID=3447506 RepID=UPI003F65B5C7